MRALPKLPDRRAAARKMARLIVETDDRAIRAHGRTVGTEPELTDLRADRLYSPCTASKRRASGAWIRRSRRWARRRTRKSPVVINPMDRDQRRRQRSPAPPVS